MIILARADEQHELHDLWTSRRRLLPIQPAQNLPPRGQSHSEDAPQIQLIAIKTFMFAVLLILGSSASAAAGAASTVVTFPTSGGAAMIQRLRVTGLSADGTHALPPGGGFLRSSTGEKNIDPPVFAGSVANPFSSAGASISSRCCGNLLHGHACIRDCVSAAAVVILSRSTIP